MTRYSTRTAFAFFVQMLQFMEKLANIKTFWLVIIGTKADRKWTAEFKNHDFELTKNHYQQII